jgi:elongation factor Ts
VKKLRTSTGAGMMDCKKALAECAGDFEKATEWLRQKGLSGADKKAGRVATEGAVARYIHPGSRLGVLLEVNCETDFVAASEQFQGLVSELGMIVASTDVACVSADDMPADLLEKERQVRPRRRRRRLVGPRRGWAGAQEPGAAAQPAGDARLRLGSLSYQRVARALPWLCPWR